MITLEEVKKIASLARIELTAVEEKRYAETISLVLDYMKILDEVNIQNVDTTCQVTGLEDVVREDQVKECGYSNKLIQQMPETKFGKLKVPGIFKNA